MKEMKYSSFQQISAIAGIVVFLSGCGAISSIRLPGSTGSTGNDGIAADSTLRSISFSPAIGTIGTLVKLTGIDFSSAQSVSIGSQSLAILNQSATSLDGMILPGTTSGYITVSTTDGDLIVSALPFQLKVADAPTSQQGFKLVGTGSVGTAQQGSSVAISANGTTAVLGAPRDNAFQGAFWVFTQSGGAWTQQGSKFIGAGNVGAAEQGKSIALSADGNTMLVGGWKDDSNQGAAWVFTRSGDIWTQQGAKLVGTGAIGAAQRGRSVGLSADGNTALIGASLDNTNIGAGWIFTRSGGVWTQQAKLIGSGVIGIATQGTAAAISGDGTTVILGGPWDDSEQGAAWIFTRSGGVWTEQTKLIGTGNVGPARQGGSVALSYDGNTALIGGTEDNSHQTGAAWVFSRNAGVWSQQGAKLVGTGGDGGPANMIQQGSAVSLSADGNIALVGGNLDSNHLGATWVFTRSAGVWTQLGSKRIGTGSQGTQTWQGAALALSADGSTALIGGPVDNTGIGAAWFWAP
jgi:hypothetical protein